MVHLFPYQSLLLKVLYAKEKNILVFVSLNGMGSSWLPTLNRAPKWQFANIEVIYNFLNK